jgi:hypothetical protein
MTAARSRIDEQAFLVRVAHQHNIVCRIEGDAVERRIWVNKGTNRLDIVELSADFRRACAHRGRSLRHFA